MPAKQAVSNDKKPGLMDKVYIAKARSDISYIDEIKRKLGEFGKVQVHGSYPSLLRLVDLGFYFSDAGQINYGMINRVNKETGEEYVVKEFILSLKADSVKKE